MNSPNYCYLLPDLVQWLTLCGSNYPYLEQISMVPKMFKPLKFDVCDCVIFWTTWIFCTILHCYHCSLYWIKFFSIKTFPFLILIDWEIFFFLRHVCIFLIWVFDDDDLGPVVQSVISLTNSLRVISLTVLADSKYNILILFAEKMWIAFALQKLLTFFQQKISAYLRITRYKF